MTGPAGDGVGWRDTPELRVVLVAARKYLLGRGIGARGRFTLRFRSVAVPFGYDEDRLRLLAAGLTGSPKALAAESVTVAIPKLDAFVRAAANGGRPLVELLAADGALIDHRTARAGRRAERDAALARAARVLADDRFAARRAALADLFTGRVGCDTVIRAARVLALLPAPGWSVTELASAATGDTKALGSGSTLSLVLATLAAESGVTPPASAAERSALWERFGVVDGAVTSRVLVHGVRLHGASPLAVFLEESGRAGEPTVLTLGQLQRWEARITNTDVYVCENPAVVTAAARELGPQCPPLVCTEGQPSMAVWRLLSTARRVFWRGDFDWTGIRTTTRALERLDAAPWLMDAGTYRAALDADPDRGEPLADPDRPATCPWDRDLATALRESGRAVMEERLLPDLIASLRAA